MVTDAGKVSTAIGHRRAQGRVALVFSFAVANACGGRSMLIGEDGAVGEAGQGAEGGTSNGGRGGTGGNGGRGGSTGGAGGTSPTGGGGASGGGGSGGSSATGGGGYGGGGYGGGGYGGGGYGGKGGYGGGKGGTYGKGGTGAGGTYAGRGGAYPGGGGSSAGTGGSQDVSVVCKTACENIPYSCPTYEDRETCANSCIEDGNGNRCRQQFAEYVSCIGGALWPDAECRTSGGQCAGPGCVDDAVLGCAYLADRYAECALGTPRCGTSSEAYFGNACDRTAYCGGVEYYAYCYDLADSTDTWACDCYVAGSYLTSTSVPAGTGACLTGAAYCGFLD